MVGKVSPISGDSTIQIPFILRCSYFNIKLSQILDPQKRQKRVPWLVLKFLSDNPSVTDTNGIPISSPRNRHRVLVLQEGWGKVTSYSKLMHTMICQLQMVYNQEKIST